MFRLPCLFLSLSYSTGVERTPLGQPPHQLKVFEGDRGRFGGGKRGLSPESPLFPPPIFSFLLPREIILPNKGNEQNDKREEQEAANDGRAGADGELAAGEVAEHIGHGHGDGVEKKHVAVIQEDEQRPEVGGEVEDFGQRGSLNEICLLYTSRCV